MADNEGGVNSLYLALLTIGGVFAVLNIIKWFSKPEVSTAEEYEKIIAEKDALISAYELKIIQYQKIIENDTKINRTRTNLE